MTTWTNWAGNQTSHPVEVASPRRPDEVSAAILRAQARGIPVKAVGAGHSFTAVAATDGLQLRLDQLSGITHVDRERGRVRVLAGTPLHVLNPALHALGLALPNLGDIDRQSRGRGDLDRHARHRHPAAGHRRRRLGTGPGARRRFAAGVLRRGRAATSSRRPGWAWARWGSSPRSSCSACRPFGCTPRSSAPTCSRCSSGSRRTSTAHDHVDMHWFPLTDRVLVKHNDRVDADHPGSAAAAVAGAARRRPAVQPALRG